MQSYGVQQVVLGVSVRIENWKRLDITLGRYEEIFLVVDHLLVIVEALRWLP